MELLNDAVRDYTEQLGKGQIQKAYRGILAFMSSLARRLGDKYPNCSPGSLYPGLMDMSYFTFTPPELRDRKLKIAIVYLHAQNRFEIWLGGMNRKVQAETISRLSRQDLGKYMLSKPAPAWIPSWRPSLSTKRILTARRRWANRSGQGRQRSSGTCFFS